MKRTLLFSILLSFCHFCLGQENSIIITQKWQSYYFPLQSSNIQSLMIYDDGTYLYKVLCMKEDYFPWSDGFYLWSFLPEREFKSRVIISMNYEKNGDTYFLVDEGIWEENLYGYNCDKALVEKLIFTNLSQMEYKVTPLGYKFSIKIPQEGFYNREGKNIIKGIVLLGKNEIDSYLSSDYTPIEYVYYKGQEKIDLFLEEIPFPVITYSLLIEDFVSHKLEDFPILPMVSKPLIFGQQFNGSILKLKISLKKERGLYMEALLEKGIANLEWKYKGDINNKIFLISGSFDGEYYYPITEIKAEDFSYYDREFYFYSFEHFHGERSAGIFYKVELKNCDGNIEKISWTRSRQK